MAANRIRIGAFLKSIGFTGDQAKNMTDAIIKTRQDLASAGYDWAGVFDKMREEMEQPDAVTNTQRRRST